MKWRLILGMVLLLGPSSAQDQRAAAFGSRATLVTVGVTVTDRSGQAVEGLTHSDFAVTEGGKSQQIAVFLFRELDIDSALPRIPAIKPPDAGKPAPLSSAGAGQQVLKPWPPPDQIEHRRLLTMLFDFSAMTAAEMAIARKNAIEFIRNDLRSADLVKVLTATSGTLVVQQDFTDDRRALEGAVTKGDVHDDTVGSDVSLGTIKAACNSLFGLALLGNKALFYFSGGSRTAATDRIVINRAANACLKSNTAIYPVGGEGDVMSALADATGGKVFPLESTSAMKAARDTIGSHYVVGYYSTNPKTDGAYHTVNLKLKRPDARFITLTYKGGYFGETELEIREDLKGVPFF